jgi:hypothetical protein
MKRLYNLRLRELIFNQLQFILVFRYLSKFYSRRKARTKTLTNANENVLGPLTTNADILRKQNIFPLLIFAITYVIDAPRAFRDPLGNLKWTLFLWEYNRRKSWKWKQIESESSEKPEKSSKKSKTYTYKNISRKVKSSYCVSIYKWIEMRKKKCLRITELRPLSVG